MIKRIEIWELEVIPPIYETYKLQKKCIELVGNQGKFRGFIGSINHIDKTVVTCSVIVDVK